LHLEGSKEAVLAAEKKLPEGIDDATRDMILFGAVGGNVKVYNLSRFTFETLKGQDPGQLQANLVDYITKFSGNVRDVLLDKFLFTDQLKRLKDGDILWTRVRALLRDRPASRDCLKHRDGLSLSCAFLPSKPAPSSRRSRCPGRRGRVELKAGHVGRLLGASSAMRKAAPIKLQMFAVSPATELKDQSANHQL
jgi:hypothetical protein